MAVGTSAVIRETPAYLWAAFAMGFFLQFNPVPIAWHIPVTRFSELTMLPCILFFAHRAVGRAELWPLFYCVLMGLFACLHLAAGGIPLFFGGGNIDLAVSTVYVLYLIGSIGLYLILVQRGTTAWFCWGILVGALASLVVFFMEAHGLTGLAKSLGLAMENQKIQKVGASGNFSRITGMWGHANEVGHVLAISAPAAGYLSVARRERLPLILLAIIMGTCFFFTANRGGIIATAVTCIVMLFARRESIAVQRRSFFLVVSAFAILAYALYFLPAPDFIYARLTDDTGVNTNASGRAATTLAGILIVIGHPFGMAVTDWRSALEQATGFETPHNGFISLANQIGVPFLLMFLWALGSVIVAGLRKPRKLSLDIFLMLAAVQLSVSFMFEELSSVDTFMLISGLIMARVFSGAVSLEGRRGIRRRDPSDRQADLQTQPAA